MRTYGTTQKPPAAKPIKQPSTPIPSLATWDDWEPASFKLQERFGEKGLSVPTLKRKKAHWQQGVHWIKIGGIVKLNVDAISEWLIDGGLNDRN